MRRTQKNKIWPALLALSLCLSVWPFPVYGQEEQADPQSWETEQEADPPTDSETDPDLPESSEEPEETPDPFPPSYYLPIQTNELPGWPQGPPVEAESVVLMDVDYGVTLYEKNAHQKQYPASITKIMTALLTVENANLSDVVTFSETAVYGIEPGSSHIGIDVGEQLTVEQSLYGLMLASANEVAMGLAEHVAGSVEAFVDMMNQRAQELGCKDTHFVNPHGLHDENHYTTAYDMALIAKAAYQNRTFRGITGTAQYEIPATNMEEETRYLVNNQKLLSTDEWYYLGCRGGKTGFTDQAMNTLVTRPCLVSDRVPVCEGRGGGQDQGSDAGRGRLYPEAVQHRRAGCEGRGPSSERRAQEDGPGGEGIRPAGGPLRRSLRIL